MKNKRIIFAVYDSLHHEYRGFKVAGSFKKAGYRVKIIGIKFEKEKISGWEKIPHKRILMGKNYPFIINMIIFWFKMFFSLINEKADVIYCHDIFPLLPVYIASKLKRIPYIYDAHEFWHGNSQVEDRPLIKKFWTTYERIFIKGAKRVITVSDPIARELEHIYGIEKVGVFTNLPIKKEIPVDRSLIHKKLGLEEGKKIVIYQGRFLFNNGLDTVVRAFKNVNETAVLVFIGEGSEKQKLIDLINELGLSGRIFFLGPFPHDELINYTVCADIGLCLIKNSGKSFYYSTPNKMFEFIQAGVPQIASDFPEMKKIVKGYEVGEVIDPENEELISNAINNLVIDKEKYGLYKNNCVKAGNELIWESIEIELTAL